MTIKISYLKTTSNKSSSNVVLFVDEKFDTKSLKNYVSNNELSYISDLLKTSDLKKNIFVYELNSKKKIVLISIKKKLKKLRYRKFRCGILRKN